MDERFAAELLVEWEKGVLNQTQLGATGIEPLVFTFGEGHGV